MQKNRYQSILYFITTVILVTLVIQVYWNFKNYQAGKQQLINEVQISLDNAVDQYYEQLTKKKIDTFYSKAGNLKEILNNSNHDSLIIDLNPVFANLKSEEDTADHTKIKGITIFREGNPDNINKYLDFLSIQDSIETTIQYSDEADSMHFFLREPFEMLTSKMIISIGHKEIGLIAIDSLFQQELIRKKLAVDYGIKYTSTYETCKSDSSEPKELYSAFINNESLTTSSKSSYLPIGSTLKLFFTNTTRTILKKNLIGILLSFLLVGAVIGCLLYLLKIINHQKQLAEVKNDLISNITHEFKTPIATINAALEGIQNFNADNDPIKTQKYVAMSSTQLGKLNAMVEKILETATLDSEELQLNLEVINMVDLIDTITKKHQANSPEKQLAFTSIQSTISKKIDVFHFENAINNIIDNAIKYGGNNVSVHIDNTVSNIVIEIKDNGTSLTKVNKEKIFEKFYRIPKGNTHDVKGFGIGLYYSKTIIEKHHGTIRLFLDNNLTNFKITVPNG